jgi:hypothetical protein
MAHMASVSRMFLAQPAGGTRMDRVRFISHKGKHVLPIDLAAAFRRTRGTDRSFLRLLLEDPPTSPKRRFGRSCLEQPCSWFSFVPLKHYFEEVPCRDILLSNCGETIDVLSLTATSEEAEECFRNWLVSMIARLERLAS